MKRKLFVFITVFVILIAVALPCFAETVDIQDYEYKVDISGDNSIVYVSIPALAFEGGQIRLWENDLTTKLKEAYGDRLIFNAVADKFYGLSYVPTRQNKISVLDIPNGTEMTITGRFSVNASHSTNATARLTVDYFDRDGNSIGNQVVAFDTRPLTDPVFSFVMQKPDEAFTMGLTLVMRDVQFLNNVSVTFFVDSIDMAVTYDSLVYMQQQTGRTNKLLEQIQDKIDGITDYVPMPDDPSSGAGLELEDKTDEILTIIQENIEYMQNLVMQWETSISDLVSSFLVWADVLFFFINIPWVSILLVTSVCFGCCATLFGVVAGLFKKE